MFQGVPEVFQDVSKRFRGVARSFEAFQDVVEISEASQGTSGGFRRYQQHFNASQDISDTF